MKKHQILDFCLWKIFYEFFFFLKKLFFGIFRKSKAAHTKIIEYVLFYVNLFDQAHYSLISPYSNDNVFKTGVYFRF